MSCHKVTGTYFLEKAIEVNMHDVPSVRIHEDVFEMTITKAEIEVNGVGWRKGSDHLPKDESDNRHNRCSPTVSQAA
jgi:hypothetical protein